MKKVSKKKVNKFINKCYQKLGFNYSLLLNENEYLKKKIRILEERDEK